MAVPPGDLVHDFGFSGVISLLDFTAAARYAAQTVGRELGADLAAVAERIDEDDAVEIRAAIGTRTAPCGLVVRPPQGLGGQAAVLRRTVAVADYCASTTISHDFDETARAEGVRSAMATPIVGAHRLYGVLYAARRSVQPWSAQERKLFVSLARETAVAMEVAASAREMAEVAVYGERQRLAVRLHDSVGATLFRLRAGLSSLQAEVDAGPVRDELVQMEALAGRAGRELRAEMISLHDAPTDKALAVALERDCGEFAGRSGIAAELVVLGDIPRLDSVRTEVLRRSVREAMLNVEKHSLAHSVLVSLFETDGGVCVTVADDGATNDHKPAEERGLGLLATAERVERLGGRLSFEVNEEGGGTLRAWVPLTASRPAGP